MRVLIVEDDSAIADVVARSLKEQHYAVDIAEDGAIGWESAECTAYDLILLDVDLPKLDGISLCQRLRDRRCATPILLMTRLMLARMGFRPILLERGKQVRDRTADTFGFWKKRADFNPESNAQFGEGGAGTFSDGKLYSQVRDPQHYGRKGHYQLNRKYLNLSTVTPLIVSLAQVYAASFTHVISRQS
ncbi:response regulator, partial [Leptolyngbya sp. DQ-M1]|uniref:response regulator n=1 Tax=Leptolyngbya sp. DQ-M1 TaxID=2933920 RepID=UPI003299A383